MLSVIGVWYDNHGFELTDVVLDFYSRRWRTLNFMWTSAHTFSKTMKPRVVLSFLSVDKSLEGLEQLPKSAETTGFLRRKCRSWFATVNIHVLSYATMGLQHLAIAWGSGFDLSCARWYTQRVSTR